ncbi:MAG: NAD(P)-dependent oxidoreductase [Candidatus Eremiobacterota bacterium]
MKHVLVTGVNGCSGAHLVRALKVRNVRVTGVGTTPTTDLPVDAYRQADLCQGDFWGALEHLEVDGIYHLAGRYVGSEQDLSAINYHATVQMLEAVLRWSPRTRILLVGSAGEYGAVDRLPVSEDHPCRPITANGRTKWAMTQAALQMADQRGARVLVARSFNLLGPGLSRHLFAGAVLERLRDSPWVAVGNLQVRRDFVDVEDAVRAYVSLLESDLTGQVFNVCSGHSTGMGEVLELIREITGIPFETRVDPALIRPGDVLDIFGCYDKIHRAVGWSPRVDLRTSLERMCRHVLR